MKKALIILLSVVLVSSVFAFAACDIDLNPTEDLTEYRNAAIAQLHSFVEELDRSDYTPVNWGRIEGYVAEGKADINAAVNRAGVLTARDTAKERIGKVEVISLLNAEAVIQIRQAAFEHFQGPESEVPLDILLEETFFYYYGTVNGNIVVMLFNYRIAFGRDATPEIFKILYPEGGKWIQYGEWLRLQEFYPDVYNFIKFRYLNTNRIKVWNNGNFYSLAQAHEQGLLTVESLAQIAEIHDKESNNIYGDNGTWHPRV